MPYAGKKLLPREAAVYLAPTWQNQGERIKALATALGESQLSIGAWHDNQLEPTTWQKIKRQEGTILSRDCGIFQINIAGDKIGTPYEDKLRTDSLDPLVYEQVVKYNVLRAKELYNTSWIRDGEKDIRRWQPWVAYTTGWATHPEWWVWARPELDHWAATGRFVQKSIVGWANWHIMIAQDKTPEAALKFAKKWQKFYKIQGTLDIIAPKKPAPWIGTIGWTVIPKKPLIPPADGVGPRPVSNNGV